MRTVLGGGVEQRVEEYVRVVGDMDLGAWFSDTIVNGGGRRDILQRQYDLSPGTDHWLRRRRPLIRLSMVMRRAGHMYGRMSACLGLPKARHCEWSSQLPSPLTESDPRPVVGWRWRALSSIGFPIVPSGPQVLNGSYHCSQDHGFCSPAFHWP